MIKLLRLKRTYIILGLAVLVFVAFVSQFGFGKRFVVSEKTTFLTGPLKADGRIDYVAAMNDAGLERVPPEHNALVELLPLLPRVTESGLAKQIRPYKSFGTSLGPTYSSWYDQEERLEFTRQLGIDDVPQRRPWKSVFQCLYEANADSLPPRESRKIATEEHRRSRPTQYRPWNTQEFPKISAILHLQKPHIDSYVLASQKPNFYEPLVLTKPESFAFGLRYSVSGKPEIKSLADLTHSRAMNRFGEGEIAGATTDFQANRRMAFLLAKGQVRNQIGISIDQFHRSILVRDWALLRQMVLPPEELGKHLAFIQEYSRKPLLADRVDRLYRFSTLNVVQNSFFNIDVDSDFRLRNLTDNPDTDVPWRFIDSRSVMMRVNAHFDQVVEVLRDPSLKQRIEGINQIALDLVEVEKRISEYSLRETLTRSARGRRLANQLIIDCFPSILFEFEDETQFLLEESLLQLAFAIEWYRAENGHYPSSLEELEPTYCSSTTDPRTESSYKYRVTEDGVLLYGLGYDGQDNGGLTAFELKNPKYLDGDTRYFTGTPPKFQIGSRAYQLDKREKRIAFSTMLNWPDIVWLSIAN